ncbi:biotin-dependent carboxyltransferase family protein [Bacillus dakarensis]|uniref:5-oxoprolinase subunit C family protein n=1 Tax=Robertmurraya dakarensis TaxID=1926278 RepID=UPI000981DB6B|nr:biotin-dependent carboxyltransferase family protein [Bacillus dakarensis]
MITILKPGLLTTVQDSGRYGYQKYGVVAGGVMDQFAHVIANILVGNEKNSPVLEITMVGPVIKFDQDTVIAICGADLSPAVNGKKIGNWRPVLIKKGSELIFGNCQTGCRAYLAAAGGFKIPEVMDSKSTYLRAGIGGFQGRALKKGDKLFLEASSELSNHLMQSFLKKGSSDGFVMTHWRIYWETFYQKSSCIRVMKGRQYHLFKRRSQEYFFRDLFTVTTASDRMGYRLQGPILELNGQKEMISEAVSFGTIQVPADGNPILLLADRQTTGGYPKIGEVASVDLPTLAQVRPGDSLSFKEITCEDAQLLLIEREKRIELLRKEILLKFS